MTTSLTLVFALQLVVFLPNVAYASMELFSLSLCMYVCVHARCSHPTGILNLLEDKKRNGFSLGEKPESVDDTMGGVLQTAFIVSYMILSPVFGYLGDRYSRKMIISFGILIWAAFTLIGSFSLVTFCCY